MNRNDLLAAPREPERVTVRDLDRIREKVTIRVEPRHALLAGIGGAALLVAAFAAGLVVGRSCEQAPAEAPSSAVKAPAAPAPLLDPAPRPDPTPPARAVLPVTAPPPEARGCADAPLAEAPRRGPEEVAPDPPSTPLGESRAQASSPFDADGDRRSPLQGGDQKPGSFEAIPGCGEIRGRILVQAPPPPPPVADDSPWPGLAVSDPCAGHSCGVPDGGGCALPAPGPTFQEVRDALARHGRVAQGLWGRGLQSAGRAVQIAGSLVSRWVVLAVHAPIPVASPAAPGATSPATVRPAPAPSHAHATALASGWFTVQVRSYRDEALAREFAGSLRAEGYSVEVVRHDDADGRAWFRVRVGRFPDLAEARDFARRLNARTGDQAIVTAMEAR